MKHRILSFGGKFCMELLLLSLLNSSDQVNGRFRFLNAVSKVATSSHICNFLLKNGPWLNNL